MLKTRCPAKINLFLSVGPSDARGYHPIRTIFQAIDLCDDLSIEFGSEKHRFSCNWPHLPTVNTVVRALRLIQDSADLPPLTIELTKQVPDKSGLGGGSSDAAGLLRCLRAMFPDRVSDAACYDVARAVGADVPFFLVGGRARAEGYGEILTPMEDGPAQWIVVVKPDANCDTGEAYARLDELPRALRSFPSDGSLFNDFEAVAPAECAEAIAALRASGGERVGLTGSGSAVFAICESCEEAERCRDGIIGSSLGLTGVSIAKTLSRPESLRVH